MLQTSLFGDSGSAAKDRGDPDNLRDYQRERADQAVSLLKTHRSCLMVLHTGAGKTRTAGSVAKHWPGRVLWLAHRDFLCSQARVELSKLTGQYVDLEKAGWRAGDTRIVVASVQTLKGDRLKNQSPTAFDLIITDEAHHGAAKSYRAIYDHFSSAKLLHITATPKRQDKIGMWNICESSCEPFGIEAGLAWGSFVPPVPIAEFIDSIDLADIKTQNGDLALGELEEEIAKSAASIAQLTAKHTEGLPTLVYTPGVASAHAVAACLREMGKTAISIDADSDDSIRRKSLQDFASGSLQYIANCAIYLEGLDVPNARAIVIARPTKSESLYIQMAGRGGRPAPHVGFLPTSEERLNAIRNSDKPNFKLIDITGHAGRHSLVSATDLLGGRRIKEAVEAVKEKVKSGQSDGKTLDEMLDEEEKSIKEREEENRRKIAKAAAEASVKSRQTTFDPLVKLGFEDRHHGESPTNAAEPVTEDEAKWLKDNSLPFKNVTRGDYRALKRQADQWRRDGMASWRQRKCLDRAGLDPNVKFHEASAIIGYMRESNNWKPNTSIVQRVLNEYRQRNRIPSDNGQTS